MKRIILFFALVLLISCQQKKEFTTIESQKSNNTKTLEVLLVGTFHFSNFKPENNGDVLQVNVPDVLTEANQKELEKIVKAIADFNPDKIFVETLHKRQAVLDSVYTAFNPTDYKTEKRNEIYQIGFRVAKSLEHKKVFAMDYRTDFPYGDLMEAMQKAEQYDLIQKDSLELVRIESFENELFASDKLLSEMLFYQNDPLIRKQDINWYVSVANQGGEKDNFIGAYLASEWYKRNLYMFSVIQKAVEEKDEKIMILGGSSHIAMFKDFIDYNPEWKAVELREIMN
ncbi:hypothetical protein SAMN05661096_01758 [Marivirga sericea]|uniref:Uncharacterized protein n=1 Tax=Marivirga sericea TaxID=1028 RepID=A0A1X7JLP9_9BACT|nr:DUF5694 domain-containing protein [Marivirga sericea]SMG28879.1 hypothetical protein SAMN05661096_01758 [Marivirga sericea]